MFFGKKKEESITGKIGSEIEITKTEAVAGEVLETKTRRKERHWFVAMVTLIVVVMAGWGMLKGGKNSAFAGTYTWVQTNWSTKLAGSTIVHPSTGITYEDKDTNVTASAGGVSLGQTSTVGLQSFSNGTGDTPNAGGFNAGTNNSTTSTGDQIALAKSSSTNLTQTSATTTVPSPANQTGGFDNTNYQAVDTYDANGTMRMKKQVSIACSSNNECVSGYCSTTCTYPPCDGSTTCPSACSFGGLIYGTVSANGQCWMDRNLGATQIATAYNDSNAYGWYFQWGRAIDGHQVGTSGTTGTQSASITPGHGNFIKAGSNDWTTSRTDNLWNISSGYINNPCPTGWHVPTIAEWTSVVSACSISGYTTAYTTACGLRFPAAGSRNSTSGVVSNSSNYDGRYWSSSSLSNNSYWFVFEDGVVYLNLSTHRATGLSVRCVRN
jgi:uncharacterized protein (TIGR02145 family)